MQGRTKRNRWHLYCLGMAGVSTANILVGRLLNVALRIPDLSGHHTRNALEHQLRSPEAAGAKGSLLQMGRLQTDNVEFDART